MKEQKNIIDKLNKSIDKSINNIKKETSKVGFNQYFNKYKDLKEKFKNFENENKKITKKYQEYSTKKIQPYKQVKLMTKFLENSDQKLDIAIKINNFKLEDSRQKQLDDQLKQFQDKLGADEIQTPEPRLTKEQRKARFDENNKKLKNISKTNNILNKIKKNLKKKKEEIIDLEQENQSTAERQAQEADQTSEVLNIRDDYKENNKSLELGKQIVEDRIQNVERKQTTNKVVEIVLKKENKKLQKLQK